MRLIEPCVHEPRTAGDTSSIGTPGESPSGLQVEAAC